MTFPEQLHYILESLELSRLSLNSTPQKGPGSGALPRVPRGGSEVTGRGRLGDWAGRNRAGPRLCTTPGVWNYAAPLNTSVKRVSNSSERPSPPEGLGNYPGAPL